MAGATEAQLQEQVAVYLRLHYPNVMFHSDFGSGIKLTAGQAMRQKRQNGGQRAWPDMFIAKPKVQDLRCEMRDFAGNRTGVTIERDNICGLFLELKRDGTRIKKKNGEWASDHIAEQAAVLEKLRGQGYCAEFAVGFEEAKKIIDDYLR